MLGGAGRVSEAGAGFDRIEFEHVALPEISFADIDLSTNLFGKRIKAPLLVSSMTGGPDRAAAINTHLATACEALGIGFAVGSQRVAIEANVDGGLDANLRRVAPSIPIMANFGAAQLNKGFGRDAALRAIEMIEADALIIHLNPLQEAVQTEGDRDWSGILEKIEALAASIDVPMVVKEVGSGISAAMAKQLASAGVRAIDVAGAGGTSWAAVEAERAKTAQQAAIARAFVGWGQPTSEAIMEVRKAVADTVVIGSGGIRDGLDAAKAIRLGADIVAQAAAVLRAAATSTEQVVEHFQIVIEQLRIACFCTGSIDLAALRNASLRSRSDVMTTI